MSRFDKEAKNWDRSYLRQKNAFQIAKAILDRVTLDKGMTLLDFGAGTGLLTQHISPFVKEILAVDNSLAMLKELEKNSKSWKECIVSTIKSDILDFKSDKKFDGIISSMTIHHIKDIDKLFKNLYLLLKKGGFLAIADLMPEDGSFHSRGNEDVFHFGFSKEFLEDIATKNGFIDIKYEKIYTIEKEQGKFDIFLLTAKKD